MPTIGVKRSLLFNELGQKFTDEEFDQLCFDYGLELDDIEPLPETNGEDVEYKIEIPANRFDILCLEGLSRGLKIFLQKAEMPKFHISNQKLIRMKVLPNTKRIRPIVVGAVLRNITFNTDSYNSFIKLQDKLHLNLCRNRTLVAIGTHDLDTIKPPFIYDAREPKQIKFRSLNQKDEMRADEMMEFYLKDTHLKRYVSIIQDSDVYPVIYDSNNVVLSLPPIINGNLEKKDYEIIIY
ncbi:unnamed protein product [Rotaria sp. Silwood1]|nr:unnamed protein product [Rotaria sp. Silwood1]CAF5006461.1 unnamed protein product [Rotaria sp. Silwood1]